MIPILLAAVIAAAPLHSAPKAPFMTGSPVAGERWMQGDERVTVLAVKNKAAAVDLQDISNGVDTKMMLALTGPWAGQGDGIGVDGTTVCLPGQTLQLCNPVTGAQSFSGAITLTAAGTALTVNNNATIGGTLTLSGSSAIALTAAGGATISSGSTTNGVTHTSSDSTAGTSTYIFQAGSLPQPAATPASSGIVEIDIPQTSATNAPPALYVKNANVPVANVTPAPANFIVQGNANAPVAAWYVQGTATGTQACWQWFDASGNVLLKILCNGTIAASNGDLQDVGNILNTSQSSGKGQIMSGGAVRTNTANAVGNFVIGGGNLLSNTNGNCTASGCGGHVIQSVYFSAPVSSGTSASCTAPIACRINSTSTSAIATITLNFLQPLVEPPVGCIGTDESGTGTLKVSSFTGTPGTSITAVVFSVTGAGTGTQNFDVGCGIGNGP